MLSLSLVIPVFNEAANLAPLARQMEGIERLGVREVVWVNNGSQDSSGSELHALATDFSFFRVVRLERNQGYGGGVRAGIQAADSRSTHIAWIPADGQVSVEDLLAVWTWAQTCPDDVHKGWRIGREDSTVSRTVSLTYSWMARQILGLGVRDVNALPKIFPANLLKHAAAHACDSNGFAFDAEMLLAAKRSQIRIREHAVFFHSRRSGKSSWSDLRWKTYFQVARSLWRLRFH